jgi:hypothetical protein
MKEKLRNIGDVYGKENKGFLNRDECLLLFENFYRFILFGKSEKAKGYFTEREYGV